MFGSARRAVWQSLGLSLVVLWAWCGGIASAQTNSFPPVEFPFDLSAPSTVEATISIREKRPYHFDLNFSYANASEQSKVRKLAGGSARLADGKFAEPGATVPIHLRILAATAGSAPKVVYEADVETQGHYSNVSRSVAGGDYYYARAISSVTLEPGSYRVQARSQTAHPEFSGIRTDFSVTYDPRFIPDK